MKEKQRIYSYRKFKGVGLASAVIGMSLFGMVIYPSEANADTTADTTNEYSDSNNIDVQPDKVVLKSAEVNHIIEPVTDDVKPESTNDVKPESANDVKPESTIDVKPESTNLRMGGGSPVLEYGANSESSTVKPRNKRSVSDESPYVSDKTKEVVRELNDSLVMKKEDTASSSDTLFKLDEGLKVT